MAQEIIKVAENNVEIREYITDKETDEKYIKSSQSVGREIIALELAKANEDFNNWSNDDYVTAYKEKMLADAQSRIDKWTIANTAMDGEVAK